MQWPMCGAHLICVSLWCFCPSVFVGLFHGHVLERLESLGGWGMLLCLVL